MCAEELVLFITTLAIAIAKDKTEDEIEILASIYSQLGDTLATIAIKRSCDEENTCCDERNKCCDKIPCK